MNKSRRIADIFRSEDGASAVEFALVAAPFMALVMAILQSAMSLLVMQGLDTAVQEAGRMVMTGQAHAGGAVTSPTNFRDRFICNPAAPNVRTLPAFMDCTRVFVDVRKASLFASGSVTTFNTATAQACIGGAGEIVILRAIFHMPVFAPFIALNGYLASGSITTGQVIVNGERRYAILAATAFRNEPFGTAATC